MYISTHKKIRSISQYTSSNFIIVIIWKCKMIQSLTSIICITLYRAFEAYIGSLEDMKTDKYSDEKRGVEPQMLR